MKLGWFWTWGKKDDAEADIVFNVPSKKSYEVKMNVKSVEKGKVKFVEPDEEGK